MRNEYIILYIISRVYGYIALCCVGVIKVLSEYLWGIPILLSLASFH